MLPGGRISSGLCTPSCMFIWLNSNQEKSINAKARRKKVIATRANSTKVCPRHASRLCGLRSLSSYILFSSLSIFDSCAWRTRNRDDTALCCEVKAAGTLQAS